MKNSNSDSHEERLMNLFNWWNLKVLLHLLHFLQFLIYRMLTRTLEHIIVVGAQTFKRLQLLSLLLKHHQKSLGSLILLEKLKDHL